MLADKTGVERGQAWLVESSFCQKTTCTHTNIHTHTLTPRPMEEKEQER